MIDELEARRDSLRRQARHISGAEHEPSHVELERVAAWCKRHDIEADTYGQGDHLQAFETRVGEMLGYPAACFFLSGTMAQPVAARIWSERAGIDLVGMHPTCHLDLHEERGYDRLHGLSAVLVGETHRPMTLADLEAAPEAMSTLIIELPTRENGGQLAPWGELVALCGSANERGISTHLDGARLWEAAAGYRRPLDEICELFDSAYVSFYKGIGALPGSILAGPPDFIEEAMLWRRRQGGNLFSSLASWVSADMRLDAQIAKMGSYRDRASEMAAMLSGIEGVTINPAVPHVNMFHVFLAGQEQSLLLARDQVAEEHNIWLFGSLKTGAVPDVCSFECTVGNGAIDLELDQVSAAFEALFAR